MTEFFNAGHVLTLKLSIARRTAQDDEWLSITTNVCNGKVGMMWTIFRVPSV